MTFKGADEQEARALRAAGEPLDALRLACLLLCHKALQTLTNKSPLARVELEAARIRTGNATLELRRALSRTMGYESAQRLMTHLTSDASATALDIVTEANPQCREELAAVAFRDDFSQTRGR